MSTALRGAAVLVLAAAFASPSFAQPPVAVATRPPEPLPMGMPYYYQPGNPYWYAPAIPAFSAYPYGASIPVYGRYEWDYSGRYAGGFGSNVTSYPYHYYYPTLYGGRVWVWYR